MATVLSGADELHLQLHQTIKRLVANATFESKKIFESGVDLPQESKNAVPISYLPADDEGEKIVKMLEEKHEVRQARVMMFPVGETPFSFQLPADFPLHQIDVEKLVPPEREVTGTSRCIRKFSFFERLKGWNIEVRQRQTGHALDSYFYHEKFNKVLRSVIEVVGFILYEDPMAVKSEKRKAASTLPKEESSNERVNVEMKQSEDFNIQDGNELTIEDIPICRELDELTANLVEFGSGQK